MLKLVIYLFSVESILDNYKGSGNYDIPEKYSLQKNMFVDQLNIIVEKNLYEPKSKMNEGFVQ